MKRVLFLDIDGVLADFVSAACEMHNIKIPYKEIRWDFNLQAGIEPAKFWSGMGEDFWATIPKTKDHHQILNAATACFGEDVFLLSSPCDQAGCITGKARWVEQHMPKQFSRRLVLTNRKDVLAKDNHYLIDDNEDNVKAWRLAGGKSMLVPRPWNSDRDLEPYDWSGAILFYGDAK